MAVPETKYTRSGDAFIAYQVVGDGPFDLIYVPQSFFNLETRWQQPPLARMYERLASFSRLIMFDHRGSGLSERTQGFPPFENQMDDVIAVMTAVGSEEAALFGNVEGGILCALFAATHPQRTRALVTYATPARILRAPDFPIGFSQEELDALIPVTDRGFDLSNLLRLVAPSLAGNQQFAEMMEGAVRTGVGPGGTVEMMRTLAQTDIRGVLPSIQAPTLVLHRHGDQLLTVAHGRFLAENIPGAKFVELPGDDELMWAGDSDAIFDEIQEFLTGIRSVPSYDRVLATVMFTDVVGSTQKAAEFGDQRWGRVMDSLDALAAMEVERWRGTLVRHMGDGHLAIFDGPARAVMCARAICEGATQLNIQLRAGLHTGEVEVQKGDVSGLAVNIARRVMDQAPPGEVYVSSTVEDLVAGSGIVFRDLGPQSLRGVPNQWRLSAVNGLS